MRFRKKQVSQPETLNMAGAVGVEYTGRMSPEAVRVEALRFAFATRVEGTEHEKPTLEEIFDTADRYAAYINDPVYTLRNR